MRKISMGVVAVVLVTAAHAWAAQVLTPRVLGWEQFFTLNWQASQRGGRAVVNGHIRNEWGFPARNVQLLIEGLDADGRVTAQRVTWLGSDLTPGMRAYFEAPVPQQAPTYRVSVFAFDWVQAGGPSDR